MKPFYLYFFLKSIKNGEDKTKIFKIDLTLLELLRCEILATRERFLPTF